MVDPPLDPLLLHAAVVAGRQGHRRGERRDPAKSSRSRNHAALPESSSSFAHIRSSWMLSFARSRQRGQGYSRTRAACAAAYRAAMRQEDRLGLILQQLNEHGSVGVTGLAGSSRCPRRPSAAICTCSRSRICSPARTAARWPRACCTSCRCAIAAASTTTRSAPSPSARDRLVGTDVTSIGLNGGSTTTEVARALAVAARTAGRHQCPQHRLGTRGALQHRARGVRRQRPRRVVRAGRPARRADARRTSISTSRSSGSTACSPGAGFTTHHEVEAHTNRALVRAAERVIVVADSSKIGKRGFAKITDIATASDIVTDDQVEPEGRRAARAARPDQCPRGRRSSSEPQRLRQQVAVRGEHVVGERVDAVDRQGSRRCWDRTAGRAARGRGCPPPRHERSGPRRRGRHGSTRRTAAAAHRRQRDGRRSRPARRAPRSPLLAADSSISPAFATLAWMVRGVPVTRLWITCGAYSAASSSGSTY